MLAKFTCIKTHNGGNWGVMKTSVKWTSTGVDSVDRRPGGRLAENLSLVDVDQLKMLVVDVDVDQ